MTRAHHYTLAPSAASAARACPHCAIVSETADTMRTQARGLVVEIEGGHYAALDVAARCDLRRLSMSMLAWADALDGGAP